VNYYNENDRHAAAWLRELIREGLIAAGEVDERSIVDVRGSDLVGFDQVHLFAGIGGWFYALWLAQWPDTRPVWTGSPPCQPFSTAGKQKGEKDVRHLWPEMRRLIAECAPSIVFGEQVLRARLGVSGSLEYALKWKSWDMPSGPPICALRASVLRTFVKDCSGWATPCTNDSKNHRNQTARRSPGRKFHAGQTLTDQATLAGWGSPRAFETGRCRFPESIAKSRRRGGSVSVEDQVHLTLGPDSTSSTAPTGNRGALRPGHSRWLMGFPVEWDSCGATAMQSCRNSRRSSSERGKA